MIEIIACIVTLTIGFLVTKAYIEHKKVAEKHFHALYFLLLVIVSMAVENLTWIFKLLYQLEYLSVNYAYIQSCVIAAWIFNTILYQSLGLFIENIIERKFTFTLHQKIILLCNTIFTPLFIYTGYCHIIQTPCFLSIHTMFRFAVFYRPFLVIPSIITAFYSMYYKNLPSILNQQLSIFLKYVIFPLIASDLIQCVPIFYQQGALADVSGLIASVCVIFMTYAVIFCSVNLIRFRFFNFFNKVQDKTNPELTGNFKDTIEYLSLATTKQELIYISQTFFKEHFQTSIENVCLNFRYKQEICTSGIDNYCSLTSNVIESFISKEDQSIELLRQHRILVGDEIAFDAYYNTNEHELTLAQFLNNINSEIFLPMYDKNNIIAYLTIKRSEHHKFYSVADQNKIIIFGTFLASAINIMHNSNTATLVHENKRVKEELYLKHQEVNQYKESIKNLLKQKTNSHIGILFYKDDRFSFGNETAQNLLSINLNQQRKHPTAITVTKLAQQVESFRTLQSRILYDTNNKQIMVTGVPHLDYQGGVILTVHYPDTSDVIKTQIDKLQDPSQIDYLLYLETTKSGKLINQIIPSMSESLLNFKIKLLEIALHKKATLLQSHSDDLLAIVEIIHHISLRTTLHIIDLKPTSVTHDLAIKLFGLNPLLMIGQEEGLLKKLDKKGTLFIKNVELLDLDTQNKLAQFIRYGIFTVIKSEQKYSADVRIICSVSQNLETLLEQNKLSHALYDELSETTLQMPSLITMDDRELQELIDGFALQAAETNTFSNLLQISKKEKEELIDRRPASLQEFKIKIQQLLMQKSKEHDIFHETHCDPALNITNPKLLQAANLGKHALKDAETMSLLWAQFNCQSKIADFLGVNRSSVQRRCKEYNLL
ncbi:sigma 54-interacting transcriptional regulator [Candidatus Babeliales bacterium]|nr:sigma 54-interacting transcriptional regulator [Candidatus Babeliales bacterium]MBP9844338.1 sigma 54-interacting transcriptional regulator [Candidatus Babeliales bacterium]